jgi:hypothetical protein
MFSKLAGSSAEDPEIEDLKARRGASGCQM